MELISCYDLVLFVLWQRNCTVELYTVRKGVSVVLGGGGGWAGLSVKSLLNCSGCGAI